MPNRLALLAIPALLCFSVMPPAIRGSPAPDGLEQYLQRLQYESEHCKRGEQNKLLLTGELRGRSLLFLVDTGAYTCLRPRSVPGLKTVGEMGVVLEDRLLGKISGPSVFVMDKLLIGRSQFVNQPAWPNELKMNSIPQAFDGILGLDFLVRNFCIIDCGAARIYFRGTSPSPDQATALAKTLRRSGFADVSTDRHELMTIDVSINAQSVRLGVDTGATFSLLDESQFKRLGLVALNVKDINSNTISQGDAVGTITGFGNIGNHQARVAILKSLQAGERTWKQVYFGVADLSAWKIGKSGGAVADVQGLFGSDLLTGHGALIDFAAGKVWFRPEQNPKR
jgi:predicted aspartyl protease